MKPTNKELKICRDKIKDLQAVLFKTIGGDESFAHRVKLRDISNDILRQMKKNVINGDDMVEYL